MAAAYIGTGVITYLTDISIPPLRGALIAGFSFSFALGQLFAAVGLQILDKVRDHAWKPLEKYANRKAG